MMESTQLSHQVSIDCDFFESLMRLRRQQVDSAGDPTMVAIMRAEYDSLLVAR